MTIKKRVGSGRDYLQPEYDLTMLRGAVRGKYRERAAAGTNLVLIEPDIAEVFPDGKAVNDALRNLVRARNGRAAKGASRTRRSHSKKPRTARG